MSKQCYTFLFNMKSILFKRIVVICIATILFSSSVFTQNIVFEDLAPLFYTSMDLTLQQSSLRPVVSDIDIHSFLPKEEILEQSRIISGTYYRPFSITRFCFIQFLHVLLAQLFSFLTRHYSELFRATCIILVLTYIIQYIHSLDGHKQISMIRH